jgi:hypothetical protein
MDQFFEELELIRLKYRTYKYVIRVTCELERYIVSGKTVYEILEIYNNTYKSNWSIKNNVQFDDVVINDDLHNFIELLISRYHTILQNQDIKIALK